MKLRSIPMRTCITLARKGKLISVARDWTNRTNNREIVEASIIGKRSQMRKQISRKPFEEKLSWLRDELSGLTIIANDGFDISKLQSELEDQIERLMQLLGREGK